MGFGKSSKSEGKKRKEGKYDDSGFTWFETSVNGGVHVLQILRQVAAKAPIPYLTQAAGAALVIIKIAQDAKDNKSDFRRLSQDAAALVAAVIESQQKSDDPARWPGVKLENVVQELVATLESIAAFAEKQEKRKIVERVMNSTADGNKIREFRERLAQAMSRFELSAHLQTYEILRLMEPMMKEFVGKLDEDAKIEKQGREQEVIEAQRLEEKRWEQFRLADRQTQEREAAEQNERERKAAEKREKEREAAEQREQEREAVRARVQTILQILEEEERKKKAQEGAAEDHRMSLGSSKRRQTESVNDHREFMVDSEDEEVEEEEEKENRHYLVRQRKKNTQEMAVKAGRPELGQKNRRQTEPANKYREPVVEMESTEEEESRSEPVRERKKAREGVAEERRRTEHGRKDRRQTEPASKNRKPRIKSEDEEEEEEIRQRPVKGRQKKVAAKESGRVSKSRKHETEEEEETEEESESGSSEEESITKAAMAGVAARLERKSKKKDDLQSQVGRFQVDPSGFSWPPPQVMPYPPSFGYQPWLNHPPQQFGGPPAGPNNWKLRNSKVSSSNDNNNYSTNYQSNNATHSNQENVGNDHSVTITKVKKTGKRY